MKAIIFGVNGQDGYYLSQICKREQIETFGVSRNGTDGINGDIRDYSFVENLIKTTKPDYVFHLAANSTTHHKALFENHETISTGTLNILESVKNHSPHSKVFITGSGVQFVNEGLSISETDIFEGNSPYSVSRIQSVYAARYYRKLDIQTYVGYLFHHESPLRKEHHVSKMIALATKRIAAGSLEKIELGDISVEKEWGFAGDIAEGIFTLLNQNHIFEACIGTGKGYTIEKWLETCFNLINKNWRDFVLLKSGFIPEYKKLISNPKTINALGWKPQISFEDLAHLMMYL